MYPTNEVLRLAAERIGDEDRAWLLGVLQMPELDASAVTPELARRIFDDCFASGQMPSGPLYYTGLPVQIFLSEDQHALRMESEESPTNGMRLQLELATTGRLSFGVGFTRGRAESIPLLDVEALALDLAVLMRTAATHLNYSGPCQLLLAIVPGTAAPEPRLQPLDETTGEPVPLALCPKDFRPIERILRCDLTEADMDQEIWEVCRQIADQFGVDNPQLATRPPLGAREVHEPYRPYFSGKVITGSTEQVFTGR